MKPPLPHPDPTTHPTISPEELQTEGYLAEANRRFFHPLGLALAIGGYDPNDKSDWRLAVLDYRDDPEGVHFGGEILSDVLAKANHLATIEAKRMGPRFKALGYWRQPFNTESGEDE